MRPKLTPSAEWAIAGSRKQQFCAGVPEVEGE
jgi:hypothetical protein